MQRKLRSSKSSIATRNSQSTFDEDGEEIDDANDRMLLWDRYFDTPYGSAAAA